MAAKKAKKTAKKTAKRKKSPKAIEVVPEKRSYRVRTNEIRSMAAHAYITDPEQRSVEWWYGRSPFSLIAYATFSSWSTRDDWTARRSSYHADFEARVLEKTKEAALRVRFEEIARTTEAVHRQYEYLVPQCDENGQVERHGPTMSVLWTHKETGEVKRHVYHPIIAVRVAESPKARRKKADKA